MHGNYIDSPEISIAEDDRGLKVGGRVKKPDEKMNEPDGIPAFLRFDLFNGLFRILFKCQRFTLIRHTKYVLSIAL